MPVKRDFGDELPTSAKLAARIRNVKLRHNFTVGDRVVYVILAALRTEEREPIFDVIWQPDQPARLSHEDIAEFDRGKRQAVAEILRQLEGNK